MGKKLYFLFNVLDYRNKDRLDYLKYAVVEYFRDRKEFGEKKIFGIRDDVMNFLTNKGAKIVQTFQPPEKGYKGLFSFLELINGLEEKIGYYCLFPSEREFFEEKGVVVNILD